MGWEVGHLVKTVVTGRCRMDRPLTKRCSNLSTCVLGKLSQELHKLQTFPRTNVGAGTPGRKRAAAAPESDGYASYGETFDGV
ncbi:Calcitonin-1 [Liparis tanakae]|uniref:Calcitonin-1 n=1 Tax=Liparis tanakae TaxID=230148 RepID=A0A4Z2IHQ4_9TELE|nr:Calcitonin-1 [Liparis tanakae]